MMSSMVAGMGEDVGEIFSVAKDDVGKAEIKSWECHAKAGAHQCPRRGSHLSNPPLR